MALEPLRTLFCVGNNQNFFDLPKSDIGPVWIATQDFLTSLRDMDGVEVIGTFDDDSHMVGPSDGWPWTFYVLADVKDQATVKEACNLLRTITVGEFALWKYFKIEARIGRELVIRDDVEFWPASPTLNHLTIEGHTMTTTHEPLGGFATLVEDDRVAGALYTDPEIFQEEMERIFYKTWVWVAHESEIPEAGSFKTTQVGDQPVIVNRDRKGNFNTLLNRCRHRGATVCDQRNGKANGFTCPYHNWSYTLDGRLRGVPYPDGYEGVLDKKDFPLQKLRTESYLGMVFATFNEAAPPLEEHLGDAKIWMERFLKQSNGFPTKVIGIHKFRFRGNWKIQLENTTDGYHFPMVHKSWMASVDAETADMMSFMDDPAAETHALGNGHSVGIMAAAHLDLDIDDGTEEIQPRFQHLVDELEAAGESPERIRRYMRSMHGCGFNLNMFPNIAMSSAFFRVLIPISVNETEIWHMAIGMDGGPESINQERLRIHEHFQGPFGFGSPDDAEGWDRVQIGAGGNPNMPIMVNRGLNREYNNDANWPTSHVTDETGMRESYSMWKKMMSDD